MRIVRDEARDLGLAIGLLCELCGFTRRELSRRSGIDKGVINGYIKGRVKPTPKTLKRLAAAFVVDPLLFEQLTPLCRAARLAFESAVHQGEVEVLAPGDPPPGLEERIAGAARDAMAPFLQELFRLARAPAPWAEDRLWAEALWRRVELLPPEEQSRGQDVLVDALLGDERSWALAERICLASTIAAADRADEALRLARLAMRLAEHIPGADWRLRLLGWVEPFVANALRVGGDLAASAQALTHADELWEQGASGASPGLLDETRRLDLKASLLMHYGRFEEVRSLLAEALKDSLTDHARARLLLKQAAAGRGADRSGQRARRRTFPLVAGKRLGGTRAAAGGGRSPVRGAGALPLPRATQSRVEIRTVSCKRGGTSGVLPRLFRLLTDWPKYLSPWIAGLLRMAFLPGDPQQPQPRGDTAGRGDRRISLAVAALAALIAVQPGAVAQPPAFPFTIQGDHFYRDGAPVFLNMISYQPLEPGQAIDGEIRLARVQDDLRRLRAYQGGSDPVLLRVYAQPTAQLPNRMPKAFYDGMRALDFWILRDIYFDSDFGAADAVARGKTAIDRVIAEVEAAGAFDRIFAWEIGNEFAASGPNIPVLESFLAQMCDHIKARMAEPGRESFSNWVTWASWPPSDPLRTDGNPIQVPALDYASFNAYSYDPERIRDHQSGPVTGTPYAGYLAALKARFPAKPLVVAESGLPDSPVAVGLDQARLPPLAPSYRRGALTSEQASEGIADRYWDARLSGTVAGFGVFEWNDEWWKTGDPGALSNDPEEHFGLGRFATAPTLLLRFKLQQEAVRELLTMRLPSAVPVLTGVTADSLSLPPSGTTAVHAQVAPEAVPPVRFRWEASRGRIAGDTQTVQFHAGERALGPAVVTVVAVDALGNATRASVTIDIQSASAGSIEILTFGSAGASAGRSSGRVANVDLTQNKVVLYVRTNQYYVQPYVDMRSIWVENDGHWWSSNFAFPGDAPSLYAWVVPSSFDPPATMTSPPAGALAGAVQSMLNDLDNDLLPDSFESEPGEDRYDDADGDGSTSLEELLNGTGSGVADNDGDGDGLPDTWERRYFGSLSYGFDDDPDGDGLDDGVELQDGTHPGRKSFDSDRDGLPDGWELDRFGDLSRGPLGVDGSGVTNRDAYELGWPPGQDFFTLTPCRVLDTRAPNGPLGGPALQPAGSPPRSFPVTASGCGVPPTARAISINITVDQPAAAGYLTLFQGNAAAPPTSGISFRQGQTRANNGILQLATDVSGTIRVLNGAPGTVHLIVDVNGYFQ